MVAKAIRWLPVASVYLVALIIGAASASSYWIFTLATIATLSLLAFCSVNRNFAWGVYFFAVTANGLVANAGFGTLRPELLALPVLAIVIFQERSRNGRFGRKYTTQPVVLASALWLSITVLSSAFVAPEQLRSLWICLQIVAAVGTYYVLSNSALKDEFFRTGSVIISTIAALSISMYAASRIFGLSIPIEYGVAADGRLIGLSFEINIFAAQCVGWLALIYANQGPRLRYHYTTVSVLVVAVLLSGTRAAWIALAVIACLTIAQSFKRGKATQSLLLSFTVLLGILYVAFRGGSTRSEDDFAWRLSNIFNVSQGTGAYRIDIYTMALADLDSTTRWLFGSGANSFSQYHAIDATGTGAPYLSSIWAAVLYDSGIVGFVAFAGLIVACIHRFANRWSGLVVPATLLICSTTTNIVWFAFTWVYIALVAVRVNDGDEGTDGLLQPSPNVEDTEPVRWTRTVRR